MHCTIFDHANLYCYNDLEYYFGCMLTDEIASQSLKKHHCFQYYSHSHLSIFNVILAVRNLKDDN